MPCIPGLPTYGPYLPNMQTETHAYAGTHVDKEGRETSARGEQGKQAQDVPKRDNMHERTKSDPTNSQRTTQCQHAEIMLETHTGHEDCRQKAKGRRRPLRSAHGTHTAHTRHTHGTHTQGTQGACSTHPNTGAGTPASSCRAMCGCTGATGDASTLTAEDSDGAPASATPTPASPSSPGASTHSGAGWLWPASDGVSPSATGRGEEGTCAPRGTQGANITAKLGTFFPPPRPRSPQPIFPQLSHPFPLPALSCT